MNMRKLHLKTIVIICLLSFVGCVKASENTDENSQQKCSCVRVTGDVVNMRIGPGLDYAVRCKVTEGTELTAYGLSEDRDWYLVVYNDDSLYISRDYVKPCDNGPKHSGKIAEHDSIAALDTSLNQAPKNSNTTLYKMKQVRSGKKTYLVADIVDSAHVYRKSVVKKNCFFVVSKQEFRLYVYEAVDRDTLLAATFPVCYGRNEGQKTRDGDKCTPECTMRAPFYIKSIHDYSKKGHDFGDGRGWILSYGHWFLRLDLSKSQCNADVRSNSSIGIHGSTNNELSVPGRDSEGCVRLRDADIIVLHDLYAVEGMKVIIKSASQGKLPFELRAEQQCKNYQRATR